MQGGQNVASGLSILDATYRITEVLIAAAPGKVATGERQDAHPGERRIAR